MLEFLFGKKKKNPPKVIRINDIYHKLSEHFKVEEISEERKKELRTIMLTHGYLNYPYAKALNEITDAEVLYSLQFKWLDNHIFNEDKFRFENDKISALARNKIKNSDWIKKEGHDIKLINLAGLKDGNKTKETGKFMDWLRQLLILPTGNLANDIFNTTIYLIPFHPREFGCAYLPKSSEVSEKLFDKNIFEITGMDAKEQVQTFITLAQLAGHPVIYDILPQTGRFSKAVLATPEIARWYDIEELIKLLKSHTDKIANNPEQLLDKLKEMGIENCDSDDIEVVKNLYIQTLNGSAGEITAHYQKIYNAFEKFLADYKKEISDNMLMKDNQKKLHKRVREIVAKILEVKNGKKLNENDITKQIDIIKKLIEEGLWPAPGGAWCSAGVPVFDKMSDGRDYPIFKHFNYKGEDVSCFANLDCQTPYYFAYLENGTYNEEVIKYFVDYMQTLQEDYNFDGFRVDHIDHIVDTVSEKDGKPISYRAPRVVLNRLNTAMKKKIPYFGTLAEYMLWDGFLKEYHQDMNFDLLWGNDIISQASKTPECIADDNTNLSNYNINYKKGQKLAILKTYNNQDGEFRAIDQYPGQLGEQGALFKWFKYKFLPGGKFAQRPMLYVDGDESFTKHGIESVIGEEVAMARENNYAFFKKFDAIDRFVKSHNVITDGEAQVILQEDDGFAAWLISKEPVKSAFLVIANFKYPTEKVTKTDEDGKSYSEVEEGEPIENKKLQLPGEFKITAEYVLEENDFVRKKIKRNDSELTIQKLEPGEFKVFGIRKG
ncbi:hypothetical protein IKU74_06635 [bacterium]|nr:hypothetical protein [bacterium]